MSDADRIADLERQLAELLKRQDDRLAEAWRSAERAAIAGHRATLELAREALTARVPTDHEAPLLARALVAVDEALGRGGEEA